MLLLLLPMLLLLLLLLVKRCVTLVPTSARESARVGGIMSQNI